MSDLIEMRLAFDEHVAHCFQCVPGRCLCEMGEALLTGCGLAALKERQKMATEDGFADEEAREQEARSLARVREGAQ